MEPTLICLAIKALWDKIPYRLKDWSKSEVLNFVQKKAPGFFEFCREKISRFWGRVPDGRARAVVDKITSTFLALNDKIPLDVKQRFCEQIMGSQYNPDPDCTIQTLSEIAQTDDEKKAAAMQLAYLSAILGEITHKQELMLQQYMSALNITEQLKEEIMDEMREAEREFAKFAQDLIQLDKEFIQISSETAKSKKEANDIIDLI